MTAKHAALFQSLRMGSIDLPNRIVMAPMTRNFVADGVLMESGIEYYRRRAAGGVGLIITEGVATSLIAGHTATVPHFLTEESRAPWRQVVDAVHAEGSFILAQLWHTGLGRIRDQGFVTDQQSLGPCDSYLGDDSALAGKESWDGNPRVGRAMSLEAIQATIAEFADAAQAAQELGFDGVQLHGAHGYLIDQFLWDESNRRSDEYGGDIAQRSRFAAEIVAAIRERTGPNFVIGFRFSQWKLPNFYALQAWKNPDELQAMLTPLAKAGVDFFDASTRRYWEPAFEGSPLNLAAWAKKLTGLPSMTVGSVGLNRPLDPSMIDHEAEHQSDLSRLMDMLDSDEIDLVGVGRALIADADWPKIIREPDPKPSLFNFDLLTRHD